MKIEVLLRRLEALEEIVGELERQNIFLRNENILLRKENKRLRKENSSLKSRLAKYETPKNSRNSSLPPSKDEEPS